MKNLVLKNKNNEVIRVFHCSTNKFYLLYKKNTGRLDFASDVPSSEQEKKKVKVLQEFTVKSLEQNKAPIFSDYYLELVDEVVNVPLSPALSVKDQKDFLLSIGSVCGFCLVFTTGLVWVYKNVSPKQSEQKIEQHVVKIVKPPAIITPEKVVIASNSSSIRDSKIKVKKKKVKKSLKRMGALAALGSLSKDKSNQQGGLNLGASVTSDGPGLRALSANSGSGGVQSSIYSKGMITAALGSGGNIKGGGGYGTKGNTPGGGKAGYGKLTLVGSGGTEDLSETTSMSLQGGGFDFSLIERQILQKSGEIHSCYDQALKFDSNLDGIFVSQFLINKRGRVVSSKVHKTSKIRSQKISDCILSIINKIKFNINLNQEGLIKVVFPFDLKSLGA